MWALDALHVIFEAPFFRIRVHSGFSANFLNLQVNFIILNKFYKGLSILGIIRSVGTNFLCLHELWLLWELPSWKMPLMTWTFLCGSHRAAERMQVLASFSTLSLLHFCVIWLVFAMVNKVQIMEGTILLNLFYIAFIEFYNFWFQTSISI